MVKKKTCPCCGGGRVKRKKCWGCGGFPWAKPTRREILRDAGYQDNPSLTHADCLDMFFRPCELCEGVGTIDPSFIRSLMRLATRSIYSKPSISGQTRSGQTRSGR